jgi:3,4-dihydroxy 2-butanone 4-phosphate synthase/GTP cyclohydrolase II
MNDDGTMARMPDLEQFAVTHGLRILSIADLIDYRLQRESLVERRAEGAIVPAGLSESWRAHVFGTLVERTEYLALVLGDPTGDEPVLVRVQTARFPSDVFGSPLADQMRAALSQIERVGRGVLLYVYAAGRSTLYDDVRGVLFGEGAPSPQAMAGEHALRDFGLGAQVLAQLGIKNIRLLTNNPTRIVGLEGYGMHVVERVPIEVKPAASNVVVFRKES